MTTLIGTPPNIIIASYRESVSGEPFRMFDFSPVGVSVAVAGVLFVSLLGWRLIPRRQGKRTREELFHIKDYITEVRLSKESPLAGKLLRTLGSLTEADVVVLGIIRNDLRELVPSAFTTLAILATADEQG